MENLKQSIEEVWKLKLAKEDIDNKISELTLESKKLANDIDIIEQNILDELNTFALLEFKTDDELVATKFSKTNVGYTNENDVITFLTNHYGGLGVKKKITTSLDKNVLKKELKQNEQLKTDLEPYIINSNTEYVVITTMENHEKMLEHIKKEK